MTRIAVYGPGCFKCDTLHRRVLQAVEELGVDIEVLKVEDIDEILQLERVRLPVLVVNGVVVSEGNVPKTGELKRVLSNLV